MTDGLSQTATSLNLTQGFLGLAKSLVRDWTEEKYGQKLSKEEKEKKAQALAKKVAGLIYWQIVVSLKDEDIDELNEKAEKGMSTQESADWLKEKINFKEILGKVKKRLYE